MSDQIWFYVDLNGTRHGPVSAVELSAEFRRGQIDDQCLIWKEGMPQWQALANHATELGIDLSRTPPPISSAQPTSANEINHTDIVYAGFFRRWLAFILDNVLLGVVFYALVFFGAMIVVAIATTSDSDTATAIAVVGLILLYPLMSALYFGLMESSSAQATLGKMALSIKVTNAQGARISFMHAIGRWFATILSYLTFYIGFFMAGFTDQKRALHDMLASTLVVDRWAHTDHPEKQTRELNGCLIAAVIGAFMFTMITVIGILAAISLPAYHDYSSRTKVSAAFTELTDIRGQTERFFLETNRCPRSLEELGVVEFPLTNWQDLNIESDEDGSCYLYGTLAQDLGSSQINGQALWLRRLDNGEWHCGSEDMPEKFLPRSCRDY